MRPNIVFITTHDLGRHLNCYGVSSVHSPAIDRLAERGVLFEQSFCTAPQCSPSRAALHTGRHAHTVGMLGLAQDPFNWRMHPEEIHFARRLQLAGYETVLMGIQHLVEEPFELKNPASLGYDSAVPVSQARELGERAAAFLVSRASADRPFYLEVGFFEPHRPYDWNGAPPDQSKGVEIPPYVPDSPEARQDFAALQGTIRAMDEGVSIILQALEDHNLLEDIWVIFTTDHGVAMPRAKCTLYDPGLEVALIMCWESAHLIGGRRISEMTSHVDMVPTLLEALAMPVPDNLHGRSFWPLLAGGPYTPNREIFVEKTYHQAYEPMRGIRTDTHKLIINLCEDVGLNVPADIRQSPIYPLIAAEIIPEHPHIELYDLEQDPYEMVNIAGHPACAGIEQTLKNRLLDWMEQTNDPLLEGIVPSPHYYETMRWLKEG